MIVRRWFTIVAAVVLAAGAAFVFSQLKEKSYDATASLVFGPQNPLLGPAEGASSSSADPERTAATIVELVSARNVVVRVAGRLHRTPDSVAHSVRVEGKGVSNVVSVTASDSDPEGAARLANIYADSYIDLRRDADRAALADAQRAIKDKLDGLTSEQRSTGVGRLLRERQDELEVQDALDTTSVSIAERAFPPRNASSPKVKLNVALGALIGLLLGLGLATLRERVDTRLVDPEEQSDAYALPVLAALPGGRALERSTEAFRGLQARIEHFNLDRDIRSVMVLSNAEVDGSSTVAWHLARTAGFDRRVLLIEADMRRPEFASVRGLAPAPGLAQVLDGEYSLPESVQQLGPDNGAGAGADVLTAGAPARDGSVRMPHELLKSDAMLDLLRDARDTYDYVVIDAPPLDEVADAIPLVGHVDGVLVVSSSGRVTRKAAESLRDLLRALQAPGLGVVLLGAKSGGTVFTDPRLGRRRSAQPPSGAGVG